MRFPEVKIGSIFVETWGYDQTNADFYQVVSRTDSSVKVRHIKSEIKESSPLSMTGYAMPVKNAFDGEPKTKLLKFSNISKSIEFKSDNRYARLWDGEEVNVSWYG